MGEDDLVLLALALLWRLLDSLASGAVVVALLLAAVTAAAAVVAWIRRPAPVAAITANDDLGEGHRG